MTDDTPCVDGCGQDAATIGRLRAEVEHLRENREAAIEGGMAAVAAVAAERDALRERLAKVEAALRDIADDAADLALYFIDERLGNEATIEGCRDLLAKCRAALSPQDRPRTAVDAPEAPGQPGRGEGAAGGRTAALCIGCGWCCQSTPRERRGEAHQGCH